MTEKEALLGDISFEKKPLQGVDEAFEQFYKKEFQELNDRQRSDLVNRTLLQLIQAQPEPCFLLSAVLDFVERVDRENVLHHYTFTSFELWLNQYSTLSFEDNFAIRAKIAGKKINREDYQNIFPIGMGKVYEGTHFVTAHKSPDLDTTIASFWGWMDAFAARVGEGLHIWNLPGGPPPSQIEIDLIFKEIFGSAVFSHLVKTRSTLTLTGNDLMTQKDLVSKETHEILSHVDHGRHQKAIVILDKNGFYLGDWRTIDVESVRQIIILFNTCLRWFENNLNINLISLFTRPQLTFSMVSQFVQSSFHIKIGDCEPAREFGHELKQLLQDSLQKVLQVEKGLDATFEELGRVLSKNDITDFTSLNNILQLIQAANLFDSSGNLIEDRPRIFSCFEQTMKELHKAIQAMRMHMEKLDVAMDIKTKVFHRKPTFITVRADVEEIRNKMGNYQHLTVAYPDRGHFSAVGIVRASDLRKRILGTVSLRDFCNRNEMTIPSYLDVISVIDHHKSSLETYTPPMALISDAQSSNALVAEQAFIINDRYSLNGMNEQKIDKQIEEAKETNLILLRLLQKKMIASKKISAYIHPERELIEYLHFLYGIIDDTDLLMKVSSRDVECVVSLLNRAKSLLLQKEMQIISLDDIPRDSDFTVNAARRILQNEDMYSLYRKVFAHREKEVEKNIQLIVEDQPSNIFADTKEQNGCCRVGQTKMFSKNIPTLQKHLMTLRKSWQSKADLIYRQHSEIGLHLQMISTIVGAEEVYKGDKGVYEHKDQMWIWVAPSDLAIEHLKRFLNAFQESPQLVDNALEVEFLGDNAEELQQIFTESFSSIPMKSNNEKIPIAVLYYRAGSINSRKAMISPYLPTLVS